MSSTDERDLLLQKFFDEIVCPLATELRRQGRSFFPHGPDPGASTYYLLRTKRSMERSDFELPAAEAPEDVAKQLRALWRDDPLLEPLVDKLVSLMPALAPRVEESGDVSPFIYVMF